ncbi:MAG: hypothetical protein VW576_04555 [Opitutae bacterium]
MKPGIDEELSRLTSQLLDGEISEADHKKLSSLLAYSADNRQTYMEYVHLESLLHWESGDVSTPAVAGDSPPKLILFNFPFWAGSMAAIFLAMSAIWWADFSTDSENVSSAEYPPTLGSADPQGASLAQANDSATSQFEKVEQFEHRALPYSTPSMEEQARSAIALLQQNLEPSSDAILEYFGPIKRWNRAHAMLTPAENGILPASGSNMMGFEKMTVSVESQTAEVEETIQVLDVRQAIKQTSTDKARIFAAVKFNQSFGDSQEGAEFGITLQAFKKEEMLSPQELVRSDQTLSADRDPSTWNELSSELEIPHDAEYVVVSLTARKFGADSLLANTSSYYADDLEIYLTFDQKSTIGPI